MRALRGQALMKPRSATTTDRHCDLPTVNHGNESHELREVITGMVSTAGNTRYLQQLELLVMEILLIAVEVGLDVLFSSTSIRESHGDVSANSCFLEPVNTSPILLITVWLHISKHTLTSHSTLNERGSKNEHL